MSRKTGAPYFLCCRLLHAPEKKTYDLVVVIVLFCEGRAAIRYAAISSDFVAQFRQ